jgi:glycerate kinase
MGKVISGILKRTKLFNKPVFIIAGDVEGDLNELYNLGVYAIMSTNRRAVDYKVAKTTAEYDLKETAETLMRILKFKF